MMPTPIEALLVYAVVLGCALYCLWVFLPASLKRRAAHYLLTRSPRLGTSRHLQKVARNPGGCGSGCDNCGSARPQREHKVQLWRRR
ncbi:MAG: hypothetical protein H0W47_15335 [Polaromonas sp.]|uniref:hypothetical protein n=1 Tax=Polaromonas sp. TaxID=1869339 RepID=UPI00184947C9|nr:hypothetical protein [Polaromonas sp.]MBA3595143.1 hypothetical protein [Polaromonas sp.]